MSTWLPTLTTSTPEEGYNLAVKLSRMSIKLTQPDAELRDRMCPDKREPFKVSGMAKAQGSVLPGRRHVPSPKVRIRVE